MSDLAEGARPRPARFPALDPEPSRRPWGRRLLVLGAVALAAALVVGLLLGIGPSRRRAGSTGGSSLQGLTGRIVVQTATGGVEETDPGGEHVVALPALGPHPQNGLPGAESPDQRYLETGDGAVFIIGPGGLVREHTQVQLAGDDYTPGLSPFADGDRDLVVLQNPNGNDSTTNKLSVVSLASGASVSLGVADAAEGDPQAPGAFVSVAAAGGTATGSEGADSRIELRDVGRPPVVLATAATLNRVLALDPATPLQLFPYPDPRGGTVAITVRPLGGGLNAGVVVVVRTGGRPIATLASGPAGGVVWSPRSSQMAFVTESGGISQLAIWSPAAVMQTRPFARLGDQPGWCLWSPDGTAVLCSTFSAVNDAPTGWEIAPPGGGPLVAVTAPGEPFAWLPAPTGQTTATS